MKDYFGDNNGFFVAFCCHWIRINENKRASFVHGFINYNMKVKYMLSTDYDQKKEILLKTYEGPAKSFVTGFGLLQSYVLSNIFLLQTFKVFPLY